MKFEVTNFNTFEVMPRTRFCEAGTDVQTCRCTFGRTDRVTPVYPQNFVSGGINIRSCLILALSYLTQLINALVTHSSSFDTQLAMDIIMHHVSVAAAFPYITCMS